MAMAKPAASQSASSASAAARASSTAGGDDAIGAVSSHESASESSSCSSWTLAPLASASPRRNLLKAIAIDKIPILAVRAFHELALKPLQKLGFTFESSSRDVPGIVAQGDSRFSVENLTDAWTFLDESEKFLDLVRALELPHDFRATLQNTLQSPITYRFSTIFLHWDCAPSNCSCSACTNRIVALALKREPILSLRSFMEFALPRLQDLGFVFTPEANYGGSVSIELETRPVAAFNILHLTEADVFLKEVDAFITVCNTSAAYRHYGDHQFSLMPLFWDE
ncbi:hypothetical protein L7F22_069422 [Adiantum nelumboides]|nr:hypothetical protein [Adiantum nelumboides]